MKNLIILGSISALAAISIVATGYIQQTNNNQQLEKNQQRFVAINESENNARNVVGENLEEIVARLHKAWLQGSEPVTKVWETLHANPSTKYKTSMLNISTVAVSSDGKDSEWNVTGYAPNLSAAQDIKKIIQAKPDSGKVNFSISSYETRLVDKSISRDAPKLAKDVYAALWAVAELEPELSTVFVDQDSLSPMVTVSGLVSSNKIKERILEIAHGVPNVETVVNGLDVRDHQKEAETHQQSKHDEWATTDKSNSHEWSKEEKLEARKNLEELIWATLNTNPKTRYRVSQLNVLANPISGGIAILGYAPGLNTEDVEKIVQELPGVKEALVSIIPVEFTSSVCKALWAESDLLPELVGVSCVMTQIGVRGLYGITINGVVSSSEVKERILKIARNVPPEFSSLGVIDALVVRGE